jgi:parallel beta-helix repeat protein
MSRLIRNPGLVPFHTPHSAFRNSVLVFLVIFLLSGPALAAEYYVSTGGNDDEAGDADHPWASISHAAETAQAGATIHVLAGHYVDSAHFINPGAADAPIRCIAEGAVTVDASGNDWGFFVDGYEDNHGRFVEIDGFDVSQAAKGGIRASWAEHTVVRNCVSHSNGKWGIFTDYSDDLLIERNECYENVSEHGIYLSNSGDRPVVRGNQCHDNHACGIQLNADPQMEGDGIITGALIENNVCWGNGAAGGAAVNLASVRDSVVRNNLLYQNLAGGIAGWGDGNGPEWGCKNDRFVNNVIYFSNSEGRWCISLKEGSTDAVILNNVLIGGARGSFEYSTDSFPGLVMNYNILFSQDYPYVASEEDTADYGFSEWQGEGFDANSKSVPPDEIFFNPAGGDFHLSAASAAIDCGSDDDESIPPVDMEGNPRVDDPSVPNQGSGRGFVDLSCFEFQVGVNLALDMGGDTFSEGDSCRLDLMADNSGSDVQLDLYVLLDVAGAIFAFPGWGPVSEGLEHGTLDLAEGEHQTISIIRAFDMPPVDPFGPLVFYSAGFAPGELSVESLKTNVASCEFYLN